MSQRNFELLDVSHTIENGLVTYKGLPAPVIYDYLSREDSKRHYMEGTTFSIGKIKMVANTGTYIDSPFHRYRDGKDLSQLDLYSMANLEGIVFHIPADEKRISKNYFSQKNIKGKAVIIHTGWDRHWKTDQYFTNHPFLLKETAEYLRDSGAALVGIDSLNIDDTNDGTRPAHSILLKAEIPIVEHLCNLSKLSDRDFLFNAVPVKIKEFGSFPVRAFCVIKNN